MKKIVLLTLLLGVSLATSMPFQEGRIQPPEKPSWFIPANQLSVSATAQIQLASESTGFSYHYSIRNEAHSKQGLVFWAFPLRLKEENLRFPSNWRSSVYREIDLSGWYEASDFLNPGQSQAGFEIQSNRLPQIMPFFYQSDDSSTLMPDKPDNVIEEGPPEMEETISYYWSFPVNYAEGTTIGPGPDPKDMTPAHLLAYLRQQYQLTLEKNWITHQGVLHSLQVKLDAAQRALERRQHKTAINQINAFAHELDAQKGKHVSLNAHALLSSLAAYLKHQLSQV